MVAATHGAVAATNATATLRAGTKSEMLDQAAFLRLLTAQMKMQDPFDPVDAKAMVGQMAQLSQVTGIAETSQGIARMSEQLSALRDELIALRSDLRSLTQGAKS